MKYDRALILIFVPLQYLAGPELSEGEVAEWRLLRETAMETPPPVVTEATPTEVVTDAARLEELTLQWAKDSGQPEVWVDLAEQAAALVVAALHHKPGMGLISVYLRLQSLNI